MKRILTFAVFFILFSCSKEQNNTVLPASGTLLRYVKGASGGVQSEFIYNNTGKIITRNLYSGDKLLGQAEIRYENGRPHLVDQKMDVSSSTTAYQYVYSQAELIYHGKQIIQKNHFAKGNERATPVLRSFSVFEYNAAGFLVKETRFLEDGTPAGYTDHSYDLSGNVVLSVSYHRNAAGEMQLTEKTSYEHDQNPNPYLTVYLPVENIPFSVNRNNITKTSFTNYAVNAQGAVTNTSITTYGAFNAKQLPLFMVEDNNKFFFEYN